VPACSSCWRSQLPRSMLAGAPRLSPHVVDVVGAREHGAESLVFEQPPPVHHFPGRYCASSTMTARSLRAPARRFRGSASIIQSSPAPVGHSPARTRHSRVPISRPVLTGGRLRLRDKLEEARVDFDDTLAGSVVQTSIQAAEHAINLATQHLPLVPEPINSDDWMGLGEGGEAGDHLLDRLVEAPVDEDWHLGDPASEVDVQAHGKIREVVLQAFPSAQIAGEEASPLDNAEAEAAPPGSLVFLVDAIDGSEHADCFGFGFSSNIAAYSVCPDRTASMICSVSVNSSNQCIGYSRGSEAFFGTTTNLSLTGDFNRNVDDDRIVVAIVGAKPDTRYRFAARAIMDSTDFRVYTTGGAPMGPGMAMGRLDALVHPERHPAWDATHLPALASIGADIVDIERKERIFIDQIIRRMCERRYRRDTGAKQVMPPTIAARDPQVSDTLLDAIAHLYQ
jgi:hypothetical protein